MFMNNLESFFNKAHADAHTDIYIYICVCVFVCAVCICMYWGPYFITWQPKFLEPVRYCF